MEETETAEKKSPLSSYLELHKSQDASDLIRSHDAAVEFYGTYQDNRELYHDFVKGDQFDDEEKQVLADKKKKAIIFNKLKPSQRAFVGAIIQQRYDMTPSPMDPSDQDASDAISTLYHWTHHAAQVRMKDPLLVNEAWIGGNAWQESMVEMGPGRRPVIRVYNMNPFAVYPDPNSRDLVERSDCRFIDRVTWLSLAQLCEKFPEHAAELKATLADTGSSHKFDAEKRHVNRSHEWKNERNGKFKVIERLYKVCKYYHFGTLEGDRVDIGWDAEPDTLKSFKEDYPEHTLHRKGEEYFFLAIACPSFGSKMLHNEEHQDQPRDPVTDELMWPWVELIDEELDGEPSGHVEHQVGPLKALNSMVTNKVHQAKHASGQVHIISPDHFDENDIEEVAQNISDGSRSVIKKPKAPPGSGVELAPLAQMGKDGNEMIDFAANFHDEVSSMTPSMKGYSEGGSTPAALNEQRLQQSHIQSAWSVNNFTHFLTKRAKLWVYYFQKHFNYEMVVRVLEKKNPEDPDFMTINQLVRDPYGGVRKLNEIATLRYDIVFQDSWQSPTVRDKVRKDILEFRKMGGTQTDPGLDAAIMQYFFKLSDAPQDLKDYARQRSMAIQQELAENREREAEGASLDSAERMQGLADREAAATSPVAPGPRPARAQNLQPAAIPA